MTDLDLTEAVEIVAKAMFTETNGARMYYDPPRWDELYASTRESWLNSARTAIETAAPIIERLVLERAAEQLRDWAMAYEDGSMTGPAAIRRRAIRSAASKILPKMSTAELAAAVARGEAYVIRCAALDIEGAGQDVTS